MEPESILVVEDSPEDFEATRRRLRKAHLANTLVHCPDGDSALDYLHHRGEYADPHSAPRPCLVLLDLHLPGTDGREVLTEIKRDPVLREIPVIVLSTSADERDIQRCYADGANGHVRKPVDLDELLKALERLEQYRVALSIVPGETTRSGDASREVEDDATES